MLALIIIFSATYAVNSTCGITTDVICHKAGSGEYSWSRQGYFRYVSSNGLPQYTLYDYCPFGLGGLFCGKYKYCPSGVWGDNGESCIPEGSGLTHEDLNWQDDESDWCSKATSVEDCPVNPGGTSWADITCPADGGSDLGRLDCAKTQTTLFGMPAKPLPVRKAVGPTQANGQFIGVGLDGVPLFDSFEAGGETLTMAHIDQDLCNAHTTPGMTGEQYHYHRVPHCVPNTIKSSWPHEPLPTLANKGEPTPYVDEPSAHSPLLGYSQDGFSLYGYSEGGSGDFCRVTCDSGGCEDTCAGTETCMCGLGYWTGDAFCRSKNTGTCATRPVTDACKGHFGPTPYSDGELVYHYHSTRETPYAMGCFGPSWGNCKGSRCGEECPESNTVDNLCVATGFQKRFNTTAIEFGDGIGNCKRCGCLKGCDGGAPKTKVLTHEVKKVLDHFGMTPDEHLWKFDE